MSTIVLDTLNFADKLKAGGFTDQQAEAQARAIAEVIEKQLATKHDVEAHEASIKRDITESENRLEYRIKELEVTLRKDIEILRAETKQSTAETHTRIVETRADLIRFIVAAGLLQSTLIVGVLLKVAHLI